LARGKGELFVIDGCLYEAETGVGSQVRVDALALVGADFVLEAKLKERLECEETVIGRHQAECVECLEWRKVSLEY
jgi:hypothetical protein